MRNAGIRAALATGLLLTGTAFSLKADEDSGNKALERLAGVEHSRRHSVTLKALPEARSLARRIDFHVGAKLKAVGAKPAPLSDDAEFIRRIYLDLIGRIPSITEGRDFLDDDRPDKRWLWINDLLDLKDEKSPGEKTLYARHFAAVWRQLLLPPGNNLQGPFFANAFEGWLRQRLETNTGYDKIVKELLTAPPFSQNFTNPSVYYQANEFKPENLAANVSRSFLGHKLECAQCHNHPFAKWKRQQFWELAAFFTDSIPQAAPQQATTREIKITGTQTVIKARFLDGTQPKWQQGVSSRVALADWLTRKDNPYFARTTVNKVWAYFFGTGLVDPMDEEGPENPPSHPELLDELAREFAAHDYDLKFLIRAIVASDTFQRSSVSDPASSSDPRLFARMAVRGLSPEQLFDSVAQAIDFEDRGANAPMQYNPYGNQNSPRGQFLARFSSEGKRSEAETSILQALFMMNGKFMAEATSIEHNKTLAHIAGSTLDPARRVEQLYLIVLSRKPTPAESGRLVRYVKKGGKSGDTKKAFEDVFWALLNSGEFMLNH